MLSNKKQWEGDNLGLKQEGARSTMETYNQEDERWELSEYEELEEHKDCPKREVDNF